MARKVNPPLALRIPQKILQDAEVKDYFREMQYMIFQISNFIEQSNKYGAFSSSVTQTAAAINTPYAVTYNSTDISSGVTISTPASRITFDAPGIYNFQFSLQLINTAGGDHNLWIWFRKNGVDIPSSATKLKVKGNNQEQFAGWNFVYPMDVNDYMELMWAVSDTAVQIIAIAASSPIPAIPSVILTVDFMGYEV